MLDLIDSQRKKEILIKLSISLLGLHQNQTSNSEHIVWQLLKTACLDFIGLLKFTRIYRHRSVNFCMPGTIIKIKNNFHNIIETLF